MESIGESPAIQASSDPNPSLRLELERSPSFDLAWYNVAYLLKDKDGQPRDIKTIVDCGSGHSFLEYRAAVSFGLRMHPTVNRIPFKGLGGRMKYARSYVEATIANPVLGLEPVELAVYVIKDELIKNKLLVGIKFIETHDIFGRIKKARSIHGPLPPGVTPESLEMEEDNAIRVIQDGRSRSTKKNDLDKYKQGQRESARAIADMLRVKGSRNPSAASPVTGGGSNVSCSRTSTWDSSTSVFSGDESLASTLVTAVSSNFVATESLDKGKAVDHHGGSA